MGRFVIAVYKPRPEKESALLELVARHWPLLSQERLVTDRKPYVMQAADGTVLEVFEWASGEAIDKAHANQAVLAMWEQFAAVCEYVPVSAVPEAGQLFSEFTPLSLT